MKNTHYLKKSLNPWKRGKAVVDKVIPAWEKTYASEVNVAIMKMIKNETSNTQRP